MTRSQLLATTGIVVVFAAMLAGCTIPQRRFARAERLEGEGRNAEAAALYQKLVDEIPLRETRARSKVYFRLGECLYRLEHIAEAFSAFEKATEVEPGNMAAQLRLGEVLLAAGAPDRAREQAEIVLQQSSANTEAMALLAGSLAASGKTEQAKEEYRSVLRSDSHLISAAIALADIYNRENRVDEARKVLHGSAAANPNRATPWLALGRLNEQEGDAAAAEQCYRQAVAAEDIPESNMRLAQFLQRTTRINEAEQVLRRVDAQRPTQPTALPDFELIAGKPDTALQRYQAALSSAGASLSQRKSPTSMVLEQLRDRALLATRLVEADINVAEQKSGRDKADALQRAHAHLAQYRLDLDPATISILQAEIALADSDLPTASAQSNAAVALAPQSAPAHYVLGTATYRSGNKADGRAQWLAALESDSLFVPARLALANDALATGNAKLAERYVMAVVRDEPGNVSALNLFARVLLAENRNDSAAMMAKRALAIDSASVSARVILGEVALQQQRVGEALLQFEQAVLAQPHSVEAMDGLTRVYRTGTITRPMLAKMERIAATEPASATLMEIAGRLYADRGWFDDAKRALQAAFRLDPQRATAASALARLYAGNGELSAAADSASHTGGNSAALLAGVRAQEQNDVTAAILNYERAIREGEHSGVAANNLAWLYAEQGTNLERALQLAEMARSLAPDSPAVMDTVGVVRLRLRKYSEAISALESARKLAGTRSADPELLAQIRRHLSEAYFRAGKTAAAGAVEGTRN